MERILLWEILLKLIAYYMTKALKEKLMYGSSYDGENTW